MTHILTLEIPQNIYEPLNRTAKQTGKALEELALDWLAMASLAVTDDPVEDFIGAFKTNVPDWIDQHNQYIGQELTTAIKNKDHEGN